MQETMLGFEYIAKYFIPYILLSAFFESSIIVPYMKANLSGRYAVWKIVADVVWINVVTNFFLVFAFYYSDLLYRSSETHVHSLAQLLYIAIFVLIQIIIPFVEAKYYRTVWHIRPYRPYPYKNCLYITILANVASAIVWVLLHALIVRL